MSDLPCQCDKAGYCERYKKKVIERERQCCAHISGLPRHKEDCVIAILNGESCTTTNTAGEARVTPLTMVDKTKNFALAVKRHAMNGFRNVTDEERAARLHQCEHGHPSGDGRPCPSLQNDRTCFECGCPVDEKTKWQTEWCPLGKWQALAQVGVGCGGCSANAPANKNMPSIDGK